MGSSTINKVILVGLIYGKSRFDYFENGTKVANFIIKTFIYKRSARGGIEADGELIRCSVWGDVAPSMEVALIEGNKVYVEGQLRTNKYKDKASGHMVVITQVRVGELILLARRSSK